jgi:SPP1 gp7 family putative phage head morphogenesis protein
MDMDLREFCGFDAQKMAQEAKVYADSPEYRKLIREYLSDLNPATREKIVSVLKNAIRLGESMKTVTQKISHIIHDPQRAEKIARTEVIRLSNEGNLIKMEDRGTKKAKWIAATEDSRTCNACKEKDGKVYNIANAKGMIPLHTNCRCQWTDFYT